MPDPKPIIGHAAASVLTLCTALAAIGCGPIFLQTGGQSSFRSDLHPVELDARLPTRVYRWADKNTADVFLTDLDPEILTRPDDLAQATGQIVHIKLFLRPRPGRTPIQETACSATMRYVVLADGRAGLYTGGGFLFPLNAPGGKTFRAILPESVLELAAKTDGFDDRIGRGSLAMRFRATLNDALAADIDAAADRFTRALDPVEPERTIPLAIEPTGN